jgi:predicted acetyltransferase
VDPFLTNPPEMPFIPTGLHDDDLELELLRFELHPVHQVPTYQFQILHRNARGVLGNIRLSLGSTPEHRGHHYAARAVRLLVPFAKRLDIDPLWITCDPQNTASRRTLELAGAEFIEIVEVPAACIIHRNGHPQKCRYRLSTSEQQTQS